VKQRVEVVECSLNEIAPVAESADGIFAWVNANVSHRGAKALEDWVPSPFAGPNVEDGLDGTCQHIFRGGDGELDLAF
jgi:hypothetical protein